MARQHGITSTTPKNLIIDSGAVYINYGEAGERLLGATRGGNTFALNEEYREIESDGAMGPVKGMRRLISINPTLKVNLLELSKDNFMLAVPGSAVADFPDTATKTHDSLRRDRRLLDSDYVTNVALVGEVSGSGTPAVVLLYNALSTDNIEMATQERGEMVLGITFQAHYDPADLDTEPWEVRYPVVP